MYMASIPRAAVHISAKINKKWQKYNFFLIFLHMFTQTFEFSHKEYNNNIQFKKKI